MVLLPCLGVDSLDLLRAVTVTINRFCMRDMLNKFIFFLIFGSTVVASIHLDDGLDTHGYYSQHPCTNANFNCRAGLFHLSGCRILRTGSTVSISWVQPGKGTPSMLHRCNAPFSYRRALFL